MAFWTLGLPTPVALAIVAAVAYFVGQYRRRQEQLATESLEGHEFRRAQSIIKELEGIANSVRIGLANHHHTILDFKERLGKLGQDASQTSVRELIEETERMVSPTMKLASQMASAYDEIRQQTTMLMSFTEVRLDPLTGVGNRRALEDCLDNLQRQYNRYGSGYSLVMLDIDHFKKLNDEHGHLYGDQILKEFSKILQETARETDVVARFGGEEFIILLPFTDLSGAAIMAERVRVRVAAMLPVTVSIGIAEIEKGEDSKRLQGRADAALYSAKSEGRNQVFSHNGRALVAAESLCESQEGVDTIGEHSIVEHSLNEDSIDLDSPATLGNPKDKEAAR
ncbi:MAG: GGDEF domain-containing protein [Pirellulaceae bacterium]|nr:GGDEF domain-containing protein [Pirellulaceae bacterium]